VSEDSRAPGRHSQQEQARRQPARASTRTFSGGAASPPLEPSAADPEPEEPTPPALALGGRGPPRRAASFSEVDTKREREHERERERRSLDDAQIKGAVDRAVEPKDLHLSLSRLVQVASLKFSRHGAAGDKSPQEAEGDGEGGSEGKGGHGLLGSDRYNHYHHPLHHHMHMTDARLLAYSRDHFARRCESFCAPV